MRGNLYKIYIEELRNGKQIRIKYNTPNYDGCENNGWWSEELWCYDNELDIFKCYYPVSSYEKDFYTWHTEAETESFLKDAIRDFNGEYGKRTVTDIVVGSAKAQSKSLSIRELAIEKIKNMSDEELNRILEL